MKKNKKKRLSAAVEPSSYNYTQTTTGAGFCVPNGPTRPSTNDATTAAGAAGAGGATQVECKW
eukprot:scaffold208104_cov32-Attheya_sp.AAC.1